MVLCDCNIKTSLIFEDLVKIIQEFTKFIVFYVDYQEDLGMKK